MATRFSEQNKRVWWVAHPPAGAFYGVTFESGNGVMMAVNLSRTEDVPDPDMIILSRPDACDSQGVVRRFLSEKRYIPSQETMPGFSIWLKP